MSLSQSLATAVAGMRVAQAGLSLVAANVGNAETPGYVRKTLLQTTTAAGGFGVSVRTAGINRELDLYLQRQLRVEAAGSGYAELRSVFYDRLQRLFGPPGATSGIEAAYNNFVTALQALSTSPEDYSARAQVLADAQALAQQLNATTADLQALRGDAELGLADAVRRANEAMQEIARLNRQLATAATSDTTAATLMDQRDRYIDELSRLMDIRVGHGDFNQVNIFTTSGVQLVGTQAEQLVFDAKGHIGARSLWHPDAGERTVGTISLVSTAGNALDLIAMKAFRSGEIAALIEMRDRVLVEAQAQLDELAAAMARAVSETEIAGTAVGVGAQSGFDIDASGLVAGNAIRITYRDHAAGETRRLTIMHVDEAAALPLSGSATAQAGDTVIGFDFSQGMGALAALLNGRFGGLLQFSNPSGNILRVLDDGAGNRSDIVAVTTSRTETALSGGSPALPLFLDGDVPFAGAMTARGPRVTGLAGRLVVNPAVLADPALLVRYQTGTAEGDATRPNFLYERFTGASFTFAPSSGIGTAANPFNGPMPAFLRQMLAMQGAAAAAAGQLQQGQEVVVNALRARLNDTAGVNIDVEMARLIELQNAYAANARILSAVKEMLEALMRM